MEMDKSFWPRCLLWHGWLPLLSGVNRCSPWALSLAEGAGNLLEVAMGSYSSAFLLRCRLPDGFDAVSAAHGVAREPDVWTDGSRVQDKVSGSSSAGAGFSTGRSGRLWAGIVSSCRGYCSVPGPLQSVQRAELWGVILALQASGGVHLGVDNLNVVRHVGRLLDGGFGTRPFEVLEDGDLLYLIHRLLCLRVLIRFGFPRLKVMRVRTWLLMVVFGIWTFWEIGLLMRLLILGGGGFLFMSQMLVVIWWRSVTGGILLFVIFIVFYCNC